MKEAMAHCPYDQLKDLESALTEIRQLEKLVEKKPGVFYLKSKAFLHFHIKSLKPKIKGEPPLLRRWADVRENVDQWGAEIDLPFSVNTKQKQRFIQEVQRRYNNICL